jgi:tetrahydromethanopterin S-methyltransferase subunit B
MAGSFGFEHDKYEISAAIGELELLPAIRQAPPDWLIIADGFSCREQIAQGTGRHALHLAEVLQMALDPQQPAADPFPESAMVNQRAAAVRSSMKRAGLGLGAITAVALLLWHFTRNH